MTHYTIATLDELSLQTAAVIVLTEARSQKRMYVYVCSCMYARVCACVSACKQKIIKTKSNFMRHLPDAQCRHRCLP
jgi:hypothetical protein